MTGNWLSAAFNLIEGINLNLIFGFSNSGILPVYISDLSYDLSVNGQSELVDITSINAESVKECLKKYLQGNYDIEFNGRILNNDECVKLIMSEKDNL